MFRRYFACWIGSATLLLTLPAAHSQELPLWELGIGTGALYLPYYRGVDQSRTYGIPFPYIKYRGEYLSIDEGGAHGRLLSSEDILLELSLAGGIPVSSNGDTPRSNMPDLDPTVELGPSIEARFWHTDNKQRSLWLKLPLRAAISLSEKKIAHQGWTFSPYVEYIVESTLPDKWKLGMAWGPLYADKAYNDYFYSVEPDYVNLPARPEYHATSGYTGNRITLSLQKRNGDMWIGIFVRYDNLANAVFLDSPLVNSHHYLATGLGFTWIFSKSNTLVSIDDD
jgi:outer membrane scaffolding protein for murein synthesis (MipA/OmpV family)